MPPRTSSIVTVLAGLIAPVVASVAVFLLISAYGSLLYVLYAGQASPDVLNARITRLAQHSGLLYELAAWALTGLVSVAVARRAPDGFAARAALVAVGTIAARVLIELAITGGITVLSLGETLGGAFSVVAVGTVVGWVAGEPRRVFSRVVSALSRARSEEELVKALAATRGHGVRSAVCLWRSSGGAMRPVAVVDPLGRDRTEPTNAPPQLDPGARDRWRITNERDGRATLWMSIPLEGAETAALEVGSDHAWLFLWLRVATWRRTAAAVWRSLEAIAALERARSAALQRERERIGRDIHDTLAQDVLSAIVHLEAAALAGVEPPSAREHVEAALSSARDALSVARQVVWASQSAAEVPLRDALSSLVANWRARSQLDAELECTGVACSLDREVTSTLLRVAHEALTNISKHAHAHQAFVSLSYTSSTVALEIRDDGRGLPRRRADGVRSDGGGFGLASMREQVSSLRGDFAVRPSPGGGTTVAVVVPVGARQEAS